MRNGFYSGIGEAKLYETGKGLKNQRSKPLIL